LSEGDERKNLEADIAKRLSLSKEKAISALSKRKDSNAASGSSDETSNPSLVPSPPQDKRASAATARTTMTTNVSLNRNENQNAHTPI
jgi:hypothetical protein